MSSQTDRFGRDSASRQQAECLPLAGYDAARRAWGVSPMTLNDRPTPKGPVMHADDRRFWLLTWTTYGTWLPGDERGFVSSVPQPEGSQRRHNIVGTPYDRHKPSLTRAAQRQQKHTSVLLTQAQAMPLLDQFRETAKHRRWRLHAVAVMANHVHLVVEVAGDLPPMRSCATSRATHRGRSMTDSADASGGGLSRGRGESCPMSRRSSPECGTSAISTDRW